MPLSLSQMSHRNEHEARTWNVCTLHPHPEQSSAAERSRGPRDALRWRDPGRARSRRIAGRSRSPEATSRQGEGARPSPCSAAGAAAECVPSPITSTPRSGSRQRCPSRRASRARRGGIDRVVVRPMPSEQGAATGAALGAMNQLTWCGLTTLQVPAPAMGGRDSEHRARTNVCVRT
jgi:hypothetical protein